ncbi:beta strand repeat-containing protein, partial [Campylobacter magnus]|uniref:beta strand repeat-containing protein n=1 Tax=Campylobacter magnus TaxID=3026462 RepID=UPI0026E00FA0
GNVNLIDPAKGTIQSGDSVTGNSNYTDTLRVSVTSDSANKDFSLGSNLPTSVSSVEKLIITAGAANVSGTLDGTNYAESTTITSTGDVDLKISGDQTELKVTAGDKKDAAITVESGSLDNYTGSAAKDTINVKTGSVKTIDTGAGKDVVTIASAANIKNEGSIKLGAGDDELTIEAALAKADTLNKISLDGGEGSKDKLTISTDITAVNSITGFETIDAKTDAKISADAANSLTSGTKLSNGSNLKIDMVDKNSLNLKNLKVGNTTDNKPGKAAVDVLNVAKGEITLTTTTKNAIVETITLDKTTNDGKTGTVTIKGIGAAELEGESKKASTFGDKLKITDTNISNSTPIKLEASVAAGGTQALDADKLYYVNTKISSVDDLASKGTVLDLGLTLATGKTLVALNNSAQNKSYIYEISGSATLTRDNITLKAIVDNAINKYDQVSVNTIEFVAGVERDVTSGGNTSGVVTYDSGATTLTPDATGTIYNNNTVKYSENKLYVQGVDNALTVSGAGAAAAGKTVNVYVSGDTINASTAITKSTAAGATVDVYLGGSKNTQTGNVDLKGIANNTLVSGVDKVYANTTGTITLKTAATLGAASTKLDLNKVDAKIAFDTAAAESITLTDVVDNANSGDSITLKLAATASGKSFVGTAGKDTFDIQAAQTQKVSIALGNNDKAADVVKYAHAALTGFKADTITNFGTEDKINLKALGLAALADESSSVTNATGNAKIATGKIYQVEIADWTKASGGKTAATITADNLFGASNKVFSTTADGAVSALVVAKGNDNAYAIFAVKSDDGTIATASEVALIATVDGAFTTSNYDIA